MIEKFYVQGFMIRTEEMTIAGTEQLFARCVDGTIYTCMRKYSTEFDSINDVWNRVDSIPEDAEYIGEYLMRNIPCV